MKFIALFLSTIITANMFAQENAIPAPQPEQRKIQLGVIFSPDYCFRTLKINEASSTTEMILKSRNETEKPKLGYSVGLNANHHFNRTVGLEMGLQFSNKGYQVAVQNLVYGDLIDPRKGFIYDTTNTPTQVDFIYNDYYVDIPIKANFTFGKKKIRFISSVGLTTHIFIDETTTRILRYGDGTKDKESYSSDNDYNTINVSPTLSVGVDWQLNSRNHLRIEPTFRYGLLALSNAPISGYLWNTGLNMGYYF